MTDLLPFLYKLIFSIHHRFFVAQATPTNVDFQKIESAAKQDKSDNFGLDLDLGLELQRKRAQQLQNLYVFKN